MKSDDSRRSGRADGPARSGPAVGSAVGSTVGSTAGNAVGKTPGNTVGLARQSDVLRAAGMKVTPQRLAVMAAIWEDDTHPTAEIVWDRVRSTMPTVSLRTVYQALSDLVELGEIQQVDLGSGAVRFDPNTEAHDHFVCLDCGSVADVRAAEPARLSDQDSSRFDMHQAEIVFRGRCSRCSVSATTGTAR